MNLIRRILFKHYASDSRIAIFFSIDYQDTCFLGATPERLVKKEDQLFTSMCLAGSIGRGNTEEEDEQNAAELLQDEKKT
ncbi:hypothetical protein GCM10020331_029870 [Ectobacillus funiculus]